MRLLKNKKNTKLTKILKIKLIIFIASIAFVIGLFGTVIAYNKKMENRNKNVEITFLSPRQAIVFWTTQEDTVGYIKYGKDKNKRLEKVLQTSSVPGRIHAVLIEDIPLEGIFISLHNESDSFLLLPKVQKLQFDSGKFIE